LSEGTRGDQRLVRSPSSAYRAMMRDASSNMQWLLQSFEASSVRYTPGDEVRTQGYSAGINVNKKMQMKQMNAPYSSLMPACFHYTRIRPQYNCGSITHSQFVGCP